MRLKNERAWLDLDPHGATIAQALLYAGDQPVRPFFQNPWRDDPREMDSLTRHLGGEWPCVPFGVPRAPSNLPADWHCDSGSAPWHHDAHGYGAHSVWTLVQIDDQTAVAEISYPDDSPIAGLKRRVCLVSEHESQMELSIKARAAVSLPVGLHPVMSLADAAPLSAKLCVAGTDTAWTFPLEVEPGSTYLRPDQRGVPLSSLMTAQDGPVDGSCLPFPAQSEDLVLLTSPGGHVSLVRPDLKYRVDLNWDDMDLPSCLLWLSNRGRQYTPWDGRVCAIGIEPIAAAFDLGVDHSASETTPLARSGIKTTIDLRKGETWRTPYSISVHPQ